MLVFAHTLDSQSFHSFFSCFSVSSFWCREQIETSSVWAQICIQRMAELAKESTTMHQVLDPMLLYFDSGRHWAPRQGLAMIVLSDMSYFLESAGMLITN